MWLRTDRGAFRAYSGAMKTNLASTVIVTAALSAALSACQRDNASQAVSNGQPLTDPAQLAAVQTGPTRDPSLPDAGAALAAMDAADKAKEQALVVQQPVAPAPPPDQVSAAPDPAKPEPTKVN